MTSGGKKRFFPVFTSEARFLIFRFTFRTACLPAGAVSEEGDKKSPRTFCLCVIDMTNDGLFLQRLHTTVWLLRKGNTRGSNCSWPLFLSSPEQSFIYYIQATRAQSILNPPPHEKNLSQKQLCSIYSQFTLANC